MLSGRKSRSGYSLVELMLVTGMLSFVSLGVSTLVVSMVAKQNKEERLDTIDTMNAEMSRAIRDPKALRASLERTETLSGGTFLNCVRRPQSDMCLVSTDTTMITLRNNQDPDPMTNVNGYRCFEIKGSGSNGTNTACSFTFPIMVKAQFRIGCAGETVTGTSSRTMCPSNQAYVWVSYNIDPHPDLPREKAFKPIFGQGITELKQLWSLNDYNATPGATFPGATVSKIDELSVKNISDQPRMFQKRCEVGELVVGVKADGTPLCKGVADVCPGGQIMVGLKTVGSGATFGVQPNCVDITCGTNRVFIGFNPDGSKNCVGINPSVCSPFTGNTPNGVFMTGYNAPDGSAICTKKTCLPGEIFTGYGTDGSATCVKVGFIPICTPPGGSGGGLDKCNVPARHPASNDGTIPPPKGFFMSSQTSPSIALGQTYLGVPWITGWANGAPSEGYRNDYRDWGRSPTNLYSESQPSPTQSGLFRDLLTPSGSQDACQDEADAANKKVTHTWTRVDAVAYQLPKIPPPNPDSCQPYAFTGQTRDETTYYYHYTKPDRWDCCNPTFHSATCYNTIVDSPAVPCTPVPGPPADCVGGSPAVTHLEPYECGSTYCTAAQYECCPGGPSATQSFPYASAGISEQCDVSTSHGAGTATPVCPTPHTGFQPVDDGSDFSPGQTKHHRYSNWTVRSSCNFRYQ